MIEFRDLDFDRKEAWKFKNRPKKIKKFSPMRDTVGNFYGCKSSLLLLTLPSSA